MGSIPIIRIILNIKEGEYCGRIQEYPSKKWVCIDFEEKTLLCSTWYWGLRVP